MHKNSVHVNLKKQIGLFGAVLLGLGSIVGTGLFLSLGFASQLTGSYFLFALILAGFVALCNALNSAQLASLYPTSGGAYEYGYQLLGPRWGFTAGLSFLIAKTASGASAALGLALALKKVLPVPTPILALCFVFLVTFLVSCGVKKSNIVNALILLCVFTPLCLLLGFGLHNLHAESLFQIVNSLHNEDFSLVHFLNASAILFVAYTGYGRIATLGEEVRDPKKTIPRSIIITLSITLFLYLAMGFVLLKNLGIETLNATVLSKHIPAVDLAIQLHKPWLARALSLAMTLALVSVLLNLILGLSRMLLAMSRRQDAPIYFQKLNAEQTTPTRSVLAVGLGIGFLVLIMEINKNWSVSAFSILIYYAIMNISALKIKNEDRLYPRWLAVCGLVFCGVLACFIEWKIVFFGSCFLITGNIIQHYQSKKRLTI